MPEQATSGAPERELELSELREELRRSQEEVLRLRDLLIGRDAELGAARGRLAELEAHAGRFAAAGLRAQAKLLAAPKLLAAALRRRGERRD